MKPIAQSLTAALIAVLLVVAVPACSTGGKRPSKYGTFSTPPAAPTKAEAGAIEGGHKAKDDTVLREADAIDKKVAGTSVASDVKVSTDAQRAAVAAAPAEQIAALNAQWSAALASWQKLDGEKDRIIGEQAKRIEKLETELKEERENFAKSTRKWTVRILYGLAVACVFLAIFRAKAALTTGVAPLAAAKSAGFLLGVAGSFVSLAKIVGAWWFEYACYAVAAAVVGWLVWLVWREQRLEQAKRAAKVVVQRLDALYDDNADDRKELDAIIFDPLSEDMRSIAGAKEAIHLLRAEGKATAT